MQSLNKVMQGPDVNPVGEAGVLSRSQLPAFALALLAKHPSAHFKDGLESLLAPLGVLAEALHARLLDLVLNLLPSTAERGDLGLLVETRRRGWRGRRRTVDNGFLHAQNIRPREVGRAHRDGLGVGVDVGDLIDVGSGVAAEERENPLRYGLVACDETFSSQLFRTWLACGC